MIDEQFDTFISNKITEGQHQLANVLRKMVQKTNPSLFARLYTHDDTPFLEPTLFAFFYSGAPKGSLEQLLFGYLDDERKPERLLVLTDATGTAYLPRLGYYRTAQKNCALDLYWRNCAQDACLMAAGQPVAFSFHSIQYIPGTTIEVYQEPPPLFKRFFQPPGSADEPALNTHTLMAAKLEQISYAWRLLTQYYPRYTEYIVATVRGVLLYNQKWPYSFAHLGAHGVAFLNTKPQSSPVFFVEDILHQCGHVIFNAATHLTKETLFAVDADQPLSELANEHDYDGSLYAAFHGLFTQTNINHCLKRCLEAPLFTDHNRHELLGRISDDMKRFAAAIELLNQREFYTNLGWELFCYFKDQFIALYLAQRDTILAFDTSNQSYIFSYEKFLQRNPLPKNG